MYTCKIDASSFNGMFGYGREVVRAKDLPKMDLNGEADPFVVAKLGEKTLYTTRIIKKTRQPEWNETFRLYLPHFP